MTRRLTVAEREHLAAVAALGCLICAMPAEVHHIRHQVGAGRRASHFKTIPLCPTHHRLGNHGVAIHAGKKTWEAKFGTELELLEKVKGLLGGCQTATVSKSRGPRAAGRTRKLSVLRQSVHLDRWQPPKRPIPSKPFQTNRSGPFKKTMGGKTVRRT